MKYRIMLSWGALLYSVEQYPAVPVTQESIQDDLAPRLTKEQAWQNLSSGLLLSMVLSLDYLRLIGDAVMHHYDAWTVVDLSSLLGALQCCFDHARCFNMNMELRSELKRRNFMRFRDNPNRVPHLLEQETLAASQLLLISFKLFAEEEEGKPEGLSMACLAEPIIKR
jgi:hypothetical protein